MKVLPFFFSRKPKSPGFGISKNFYLSVLSSKPVLPSMVELLNPKGYKGANVGMGAPLAEKSGTDLTLPLVHGAYALVTMDRKTIVKMLIMNPSEAGYDPEVYAASPAGLESSREVLNRIRATWILAQFNIESYHPSVFPSIHFMLRCVARLAELTEAAIADPICERYFLPEELHSENILDESPILPQELVKVHFVQGEAGFKAYTLGLQKIDQPELEFNQLEESDQPRASRFLLQVVKLILQGHPLKLGDLLGPAKQPAQVGAGGFDRGLWEGIPCFELMLPTGINANNWLAQLEEAS